MEHDQALICVGFACSLPALPLQRSTGFVSSMFFEAFDEVSELPNERPRRSKCYTGFVPCLAVCRKTMPSTALKHKRNTGHRIPIYIYIHTHGCGDERMKSLTS